MYSSYSYGYGSDDEYIMKRRIAPGKYSREDFKEQYCINDKSLDQLDRSRSSLGLFGCLSSYQDSPCNKRHHNVFTSCYGRRYPSDEHLSIVDSTAPKKTREWRDVASSGGEQSDGEGGFTPRPRSAIGWSTGSSSSRDGHYNKRYTWDPETHSYIPVSMGSSGPRGSGSSSARLPAQRYASAPLNQMSRKHVSFENSILNRSSTATSFEETKLRRAVMIMGGSVERLLETGGSREQVCPGHSMQTGPRPVSESQIPGTGVKRLTKTQSTQTETFIVRASGPPPYLSLSPRTSYRVRMVSQGAQTNGGLATTTTKIISKSMSTNINKLPKSNKKLTKTLSDGEILVEKKRATTPYIDVDIDEKKGDDDEPAIVKHKLVEDTEECFHEDIIQRRNYNLKLSTSIDSSRDQTEQSFSSEESSSSGSYSLDFKHLMKKSGVHYPLQPAVIAQETEPDSITPPPPIPLPDPPPNGGEEINSVAPLELLNLLVKPPVEFCDDQPVPLGKKRKRQRKFRAKSEERFHRADASTQSNISLSLRDLRGVSPGDAEEEGVYTTPYDLGIWVYIGESEESQVWKRHEPLSRTSSGDSTLSEKEFTKRYTAITHRMVHRKASGETYRRLSDNSLEITKRLQIHRAGGEFGFRIHGSRPVVVSAVEENTPAEESGLEVGDVIMSINGVHVLESSHSDVVKLAKGDVLELELARTADVVRDLGGLGPSALLEGRLWKVNKNGGWVERYFHLTPSCLYWYKNALSTHPLGVFPIIPEQTLLLKDLPQDPYHVFTLKRTKNGAMLRLATPDIQTYKEWTTCIIELLAGESQDIWVRKSHENVLAPPRAIPSPDCYGTLSKWWNRIWTKRFCVLKDACLYFYQGEEAPVAISAAHLHGYRINMLTSLGGKKYVFELIPPEANLRHYYLAAENEHERKRWLAALEYSIDRWINVNK